MGVERSPKKDGGDGRASVSEPSHDSMTNTSEGLRKLRRDRGFQRSITTKKITALEALLATGTDIYSITSEMNMLIKYQTALQGFDAKILDLVDDDDEAVQTEMEECADRQGIIEAV
jgi:hypothetical protein